MLRAIGRFVIQRWLTLAAALSVAGLLACLAYVNVQGGREQAAVTAQKRVTTAVEGAHAKGLPAPPPATGTAEQQAVQGYQQHLLTPPPGPGTMADVEADAISLGYLFSGAAGHTEWVQQVMRLRNTSAHELTALVVPLLPGAFDGHVPDIPGESVDIAHNAMTLNVRLRAQGSYETIQVAYQVPFDFLATQTWSMPTYSQQGLWIGFWPQETYLAVHGPDFHRAPALDQVTGGGIVWTSAAPLTAGVKLTWEIVPADLATYPTTAGTPPIPRQCVNAKGQPLCKPSGG